ncbi:protein of unknown function [Streptantibioticus cattleyicolor NRRL 8057 = DSM 46488]|nr:protein of unknown function [Streptantibioticus cattleyicolor NRRL 8057 = DSM 46488]
MTDPLRKVIESLPGCSDAEVAALLAMLGARPRREPQRTEAPWAALPKPKETPSVRSTIEWI